MKGGASVFIQLLRGNGDKALRTTRGRVVDRFQNGLRFECAVASLLDQILILVHHHVSHVAPQLRLLEVARLLLAGVDVDDALVNNLPVDVINTVALNRELCIAPNNRQAEVV